MTLRAFPGWPHPLGATQDGSGVNFWMWSTTTPPKETITNQPLSFRGIDNLAYHRVLPGSDRHDMDYTDTGNTLNMQH